jgi:hypothetical protein
MDEYKLMTEEELLLELKSKRSIIKGLKKQVSDVESDVVGIKEALLKFENKGLKKFGA